MSISYEYLTEARITRELFQAFIRRQEVTQCWRKEDGKWILKDISFVDDWGEKEYEFLVKCLKHTVNTKGMVCGAFENGKLAGFVSVESKKFGSRNQYVQLSCIHVSQQCRGMGIGKQLFHLACSAGRASGARKLYISAHSAKETQAFYHAMGCVEAQEYDKELSEAEPCDCQLEKLL